MVVIVCQQPGSRKCCSCIAIAHRDLFFPILIVKTLILKTSIIDVSRIPKID
jgi:hypothetical protein